MRSLLHSLGRGLSGTWHELLVGVAALAGWVLLTDAVAAFAGPVAWKISGGLLCFSLCGWKLLGIVAWDGLYVLSRDDLKKGARRG